MHRPGLADDHLPEAPARRSTTPALVRVVAADRRHLLAGASLVVPRWLAPPDPTCCGSPSSRCSASPSSASGCCCSPPAPSASRPPGSHSSADSTYRAPTWVWLAFAETPTPATIAGGLIVIAAVTLNTLLARSRQPAVPPDPVNDPDSAQVPDNLSELGQSSLPPLQPRGWCCCCGRSPSMPVSSGKPSWRCSPAPGTFPGSTISRGSRGRWRPFSADRDREAKLQNRSPRGRHIPRLPRRRGRTARPARTRAGRRPPPTTVAPSSSSAGRPAPAARRHGPAAPRTPCPAARTSAPPRRVPAITPRVPPAVRRPRATHMSSTTHAFRDSDFRRFWLRPAIIWHDPGLAASPLRHKLEVERSRYSPFP